MDEKQIQNELMNYNAWLNGLYMFDAISKSIYNNFGRKNGQEFKMYLDRPYDFNKSSKEIEKEEQLRNEQKVRDALKKMKDALKQ